MFLLAWIGCGSASESDASTPDGSSREDIACDLDRLDCWEDPGDLPTDLDLAAETSDSSNPLETGNSDGPANYPARAGALLRVDHHTEIAYGSGTEPGKIWLPLPLDYASQVPLYVEFATTENNTINSISYVEHECGNWGAVVQLAEEAAPEPVVITWTGVVLVRDVLNEERTVIYATDEDPSRWSSATAIADSSYPPLVETCDSLVSDDDTAIERMKAVIEWTSRNIGSSVPQRLDSTAVFESRAASCTGFANLATAMGRAVDLPTRTLVNYMVGMAQQTHYINEFYLGPDMGWRRVEPQGARTTVSEDYCVAMRITLPEDEGALANAWRASRWYYMPGIPLYSLLEPQAGASRMVPDFESEFFPGAPGCDNLAERQARLAASEQMIPVFDRARELWRIDHQAYLNGGLAPERMAIRRQALDVTELDDVIDILDALDRVE